MMSPDERFTDIKPCRKSRSKNFSGEEISIIDGQIRKYLYIDAHGISDLSHDSIWASLEDSDEMPLDLYQFQPVYSNEQAASVKNIQRRSGKRITPMSARRVVFSDLARVKLEQEFPEENAKLRRALINRISLEKAVPDKCKDYFCLKYSFREKIITVYFLQNGISMDAVNPIGDRSNGVKLLTPLL